jgi:hypothetical protein
LYYSTYGYSQGIELDFQVIAMYGYYYTQEPASHDPFVPSQTVFGVIADGESGWSPTQTLTIGQNSATTTPTPTVPELSWLAIMPLLLSAFSLAIIFRHRKNDNLAK